MRTRTERMADFDSLRAVESDLEGLAKWEPALVARLERRPGQKEERWAQLLARGADTGVPATVVPTVAPPAARADWTAPAGAAVTDPSGAPGSEERPTRAVPGADLEQLRSVVAELQAEVHRLRVDLDRLRSELGA